MMEKDLNYYLKLPYTIIVKQDDDNDGSLCYVASFLELPYCIGVGKTPSEAIKELGINQRLKIKTHLEEGFPIPEPQTQYSGNINIRVDPALHARLAQEAGAYDMSLNKYVSLLLERRQSPVCSSDAVVVREPRSKYRAGNKKRKA